MLVLGGGDRCARTVSKLAEESRTAYHHDFNGAGHVPRKAHPLSLGMLGMQACAAQTIFCRRRLLIMLGARFDSKGNWRSRAVLSECQNYSCRYRSRRAG
ncbi:hypothetical protein ACLK19_24755 [Escherichia coli]